MKLFALTDYANSELPLMVWRQDRLECREEAHRHDCLEMMLILSGAGVCSVNNRNYPVVAGDLYLMTRSDVHAFVADRNMSFYNFMFSESLFSAAELTLLRRFSLFDNWLSTPQEVPRKYHFSPGDDRLFGLSEHLAEEFRRRHCGFELAARALFVELLVEFLRRATAPPTENGIAADDLRLSRALHYLHAHSAEKITLKELTRAGGCSADTLEELFQRHIGIPAFEYLSRYRIERGRQALENPKLSITEIAETIGFCDVSHFSRTFRRRLGLSPREYRKLASPGE